MRRWAATAARVLGVLGVSTAPAHADPLKAPNIEPFPITCDEMTYAAVIAPGQGRWTPALVTTRPMRYHASAVQQPAMRRYQ